MPSLSIYGYTTDESLYHQKQRGLQMAQHQHCKRSSLCLKIKVTDCCENIRSCTCTQELDNIILRFCIYLSSYRWSIAYIICDNEINKKPI